MLRVNRLVFILVLATLLAACAGPAAAPTATLGPVTPTAVPPTSTPVPPTAEPAPVAAAPEPATATEPQLQPHQPRPDAPPYALRGPYAVGVRDFVIDTPDRKIPVTVWYPAQNPDGKEEAVTYTMDFLADPASGFPTGGRALRDAAPDPSGGAYPLVLYSDRRVVLPCDSRLLHRAPGLARVRGHGGCTRGQLGDFVRVHLQE